MMKESSACSNNLSNRRNLKGLMNKSRARKIAKRILELGSGKNLILSSSNRINQESDRESECCSVKALILNHGNFKKSGAPSRLMFFCNGSWNDFPESVFDSLKEGFVAGKPAIEVVTEGLLYIVDFLRMLMLDLKVGKHRSIAWIDEVGCCFFPKFVVGGSEVDGEVLPNLKLENELRIRNESGSEREKGMNLNFDLEIPKNRDRMVSSRAELAENAKSKRRCPSDHPQEQSDESHVNDLQTHKRICIDRSGGTSEPVEPSKPESSTNGSDSRRWTKQVTRSSLPALQVTHMGPKMTFPNLFFQLVKFLPLTKIRELEYLYAGYKAGKINKNFLIRQVRSIVGDQVLISAIQSLRK